MMHISPLPLHLSTETQKGFLSFFLFFFFTKRVSVGGNKLSYIVRDISQTGQALPCLPREC